jgi:hypothetical protein
MPKRGLMTIAKDNSGGGIEAFHFLISARVAGATPNLAFVFPL